MCLQFLRLLESPSILLAHALPTLGSVNSVNSKTVSSRAGSVIQFCRNLRGSWELREQGLPLLRTPE